MAEDMEESIVANSVGVGSDRRVWMACTRVATALLVKLPSFVSKALASWRRAAEVRGFSCARS